MIERRKTSLAERVQIAKHCIEHEKDYQMTMDTYHVSYSQVPSWVKKYEVGGEEALVDRRGRAKPESEMTPEDKERLQNRLELRKQLNREMKRALSTKLNEKATEMYAFSGIEKNRIVYKIICDLHKEKGSLKAMNINHDKQH